MTSTARFAALLIATTFLLATALSASAATITWSAPKLIASYSDSVVSTSGTLVEALNFGQLTDRTVNGVLFDGQSPTTNGALSNFAALGNSSTNANYYQDGGVGADFEGLLDSYAWKTSVGSTSVVLKNLTPLTTYHVQFFISDDSDATPSGASNYETTFSAGNASLATSNGTSFSVIGTFTADGSSQFISIENTLPPSTSGRPFVNGYQYRTGIIPEPGALALALCGLAAVGFFARRRLCG